MSFSKKQILIMISTGILLMTAAILLQPGATAQAQCGSQASSCKNCHEVQAKDPVNSDGTGWHESHAFGDFCYICHAGNNQSMDEATAHAGMVPPLSDIQAACQSCHLDDLTELAQVYATTLGVQLGEAGAPVSTPPAVPETSSGGDPTGTGMTTSGDEMGAAQPEDSASLVVGSDEVIDYQQRYDQVVLGIRPVNWGNIILTALVSLMLLGGGAFVYANERKRRGLPILRARPAALLTTETELPMIEGIPAEVVELLPKIARLNPRGLHALHRLLENPDSASELFHSLSRLDPDLVNRVRTLDRSTRELLLAMSGD